MTNVAPKEYHFVTVVWGDSYIDTFLDLTLPCLHAQGNLPSWPYLEHSSYQILTDSSGCARLESSDEVALLRRIMPVNIVKFEEIVEVEDHRKYSKLTEGHRRAIQEAEKRDAAMIFLTPDMILSTNLLAGLVLLMNRGFRVVLLPLIRLRKKPVVQTLKSRVSQDSVLSVGERELTGIALENLHPISNGMFWNSRKTTSLCHFYWEVCGQGLVTRCLLPYPLMIYPTVTGNYSLLSIDNDYTLRACPDRDQTYVVKDSDEMAAFCLDDEQCSDIFEYRNRPREGWIRSARWITLNSNPHHLHFLRKTSRFHTREINSSWRAVEAQADRSIRILFFLMALWKGALALHEWFLRFRCDIGLFPTSRIVGSDNMLGYFFSRLLRNRTLRDARRLSLYGAGLHTRRLLSLPVMDTNRVAAIFDDNPSVDQISGIPVMRPDHAFETDFDVLVISSDTLEQQLLDSARKWMPAGRHIASIYRLRTWKT